MIISRLTLVTTTLLLLLITQTARGDWINITGAELSSSIAEFYIEDGKLVLTLEIGESDKTIFSDLLSNNESTKSDIEKDRKHFFHNTLVIEADGVRLQGIVKVLETRERIQRPSRYNPFPEAQVPSRYVTYVEIEYPINQKPKTIEFNPPLNDAGFAATAIGFVVYHKSIPVIDFRFLAPGLRLNLDWNDPWYSKFENPNLKRHHSSSLMPFLYIEPFEVRHEILVRLKDMENWIELEYNNNEILDSDEKGKIKENLAQYFLSHNTVEIDGEQVEPILDRIVFVKPNLNGIQYLEDSEDIEYLSAIVGIIIAYPTAGMPQKVTLDWEMFSDKIQKIPARMTDPAGPFPYFLFPDDNILTWNNYLTSSVIPEISEIKVENVFDMHLPIGTLVILIIFLMVVWHIKPWNPNVQKSIVAYLLLLVLLITGILLYPYFRISITEKIPTTMISSEEESTIILQNLIKNIYRGFEFKNEEDIYDKLALTLEGELLNDIYLETRKSMQFAEQGGAKAKVVDVRIVQIISKPMEELGLKYLCTWRAYGTVEHWGHKHNRINEYQAEIIVKPIDGFWKITNIDLIEEKRVQPI